MARRALRSSNRSLAFGVVPRVERRWLALARSYIAPRAQTKNGPERVVIVGSRASNKGETGGERQRGRAAQAGGIGALCTAPWRRRRVHTRLTTHRAASRCASCAAPRHHAPATPPRRHARATPVCRPTVCRPTCARAPAIAPSAIRAPHPPSAPPSARCSFGRRLVPGNAAEASFGRKADDELNINPPTPCLWAEGHLLTAATKNALLPFIATTPPPARCPLVGLLGLATMNI